jgi:hypothetical protein
VHKKREGKKTSVDINTRSHDVVDEKEKKKKMMMILLLMMMFKCV